MVIVVDSSISKAQAESLSPRSLLRATRGQPLAFYCACLYLLFEYVRPQTIYPSLDFFPWAAFFASGALVFSLIRGSSYRVRTDGIGKAILLYAAVVLISTMFSVYPSQSFADLNTFFPWVVIYFGIVRSVSNRSQFFLFLLLYLICNLKMTQHGFLSWVSRGFSFTSWGVVGGPGWFHNSGEFGIQLCIFAPLSVSFAVAMWSRTNRVGKGFLVLMPVTAIFSVVASSSRGAVVGLLAGVGWSARHMRQLFAIGMVVGLVGTAILVSMPAEFKERFESIGEDRTSLHRLDRWNKAWDTIKERPIFGVGHSAWVRYYGERLSYGPPGSPMVHNMFFQCATELGLVGLAVFLVLLGRMFGALHKVRRQAKQMGDSFAQYVASGLEAGLVGLIVSSMFVTVLYYPYVWIHAAFVTAFAQSFRTETP